MPWKTAVGESEMAELHPFRTAGGQMLEPGRSLDGAGAETGELGSQKQERVIMKLKSVRPFRQYLGKLGRIVV